jgi:zinc protease
MRPFSLLCATLLLASGCVTTEHKGVAPHAALLQSGPDPRAQLPRLAESERRASLPAMEGMRVITQLSKSDPIVSLRAVFLTGSRHDPVGKEGLTWLCAHLMREATASLSQVQLREALFPWAAELEVQVDKETTVFAGRVHRDHAEGFTRLFLDVLLAPRLDEADLARLKSRALDHLRNELRQGNDELLQREALEVALFDVPMAAASGPAAGQVGGPGNNVPRHPYRHAPVGTVQGLESISLEDVKQHLRGTFTQDRMLLGVAGGGGPRLVEELQRALSELPAKSTPAAPLPVAQQPLTSKALILSKRAPGTAISLGYVIGVDKSHADYPALKVAEAFFGEHRNRVGRLFQTMREERGLNYGDYAYVEHFVQEGWSKDERLNIGRRQQYFSIWLRPVEHKNGHFALRQAAFELERFTREGIPDDGSFDRLVTFLLGHWQQKEQRPMRRLGYALDDVFYGTGHDRDGLRARLKELTRDDVNAVIKRHLRADRLHMVIVTEGGEAFGRRLVEGAPSPIEYPAEKPARILEEDKRISTWDLGLKAKDVKVVTPETLFER